MDQSATRPANPAGAFPRSFIKREATGNSTVTPAREFVGVDSRKPRSSTKLKTK
jgi:hypothetical protein